MPWPRLADAASRAASGCLPLCSLARGYNNVFFDRLRGGAAVRLNQRRLAKRRFRIETGNVHDVRIEISNAPSGPYSVIIQGVDRGVISVDSLGQGEIEYSTNPQAGEHPLNFPFDVGTEVDLSFQGTRLAYSLSNDSACQNAGGT